MILLDTNVMSEAWKLRPNSTVLAWLDAQPSTSLFLCTPVLAELHYGVERLASGRRKERIGAYIDRLETDLYRDRILSVDVAVAWEFGRVGAKREKLGVRIEPMDALIAAIALVHHAALATRDASDFAYLGLDLINPFEPTAPAI
jgi:toxin FitB